MKTRMIIAINLNSVFAVVKKSLKMFFLGFIFTTASVVFIAVKIPLIFIYIVSV